MSKWGIIRDDEGLIHFAPVLSDGRLHGRHSLHEFCPCGPREEIIYNEVVYGERNQLFTHRGVIWIHEDRDE